MDGRSYDVLRLGLALTFVVRHSDWLRPFAFLEHHRFVRGLLFLGSTPAEPALVSPLPWGIALGAGLNDALVYLRTGLSLFLLLGIRIRVTALLLAVTSLTLLGADRYRYYHHLYLLYVAVACLALTPERTPWSLERRLFGGSSGPTPIWPLQLLRALVLSVYLAAGLSKLDAGWLRGEALDHLARLHILSGGAYELARNVLGNAGIAIVACAAELGLPALLGFSRTRRGAVVLAWLFHLGISLSMPVYSFGVQMAVLVFGFWPQRFPPSPESPSRLDASEPP